MSPSRDGSTPLTLIQGGLTVGDGPAIDDDAPVTKRCGRCLDQFPADADVDPIVIPDFWMCPPCREKLLGKLSDAGASVVPAVIRRTSG